MYKRKSNRDYILKKKNVIVRIFDPNLYLSKEDSELLDN